MSYDVTLAAEGTASIDLGNYTSNCRDMFELALGRPILKLDGVPAAGAARILRKAVDRMHAYASVYAALDPASGWGDSVSAREWLERMAGLCEENPDRTMRVNA